MAVPGCSLSPDQFSSLLTVIHLTVDRLLKDICPYQSVYLNDCVKVHLDSSLLDSENWKPIQLNLARLQSDIERLTHIIEYTNGILNS